MSLGLALAVAGAALPTVAPAGAPESERVMLDRKGGDSPALAPDAAAPGGEAAEGQGLAEDPIDEAYTSDQLDATARAELDTEPVDQTRSLVLYAGLVLAAFSLAILIIVTFARRRSYDRLLR